MAQVYSHSLCNISADWGDDSNGLFFERKGSFEAPCALHMRWSLASLTEPWQAECVLSLPPDGGLCHIVHSRGWSENVMESPLNQRGWVLQERHLAPRILHFTPEGVSWECEANIAWERAPMGFSGDKHAYDCGLYDLAFTLRMMRRLRLREPDGAVDWPKLVADYTRCSLTKQSDRLVAVAGVAKVLAHTVKDQYVAGIWSKALPEALSWFAYGKRDRMYSPATSYFTPTFSWAAAEGKVGFLDLPSSWKTPHNTSATFVQHRENPHSSSTDTTVRAEVSGQRLTDDVFGPITKPEVEVRMQGILRSCRRVPLQMVPNDHKGAFISWACPSADTEDPAISSCFEEGTAFAVLYDRAAEEDAQLDSVMYYYTIISCDSYKGPEPGDFSDYSDSKGILLKSVVSDMGRFERVGYIFHERLRGDKGGLGNICRRLGNEHDLPAWYDEARDRHTFYIL
ncbi:heterokaryon incompatibility protein [Diaporthe helianthi]|uniref:Heterokaryon incompatibility protein n=1 Tax=Diaporthe helianthi TaxID=158607 RepID=A0A2P5I3W5_DIAHE|nr:heterokaryon incompatibility protein [Diaporthe helianthi]